MRRIIVNRLGLILLAMLLVIASIGPSAASDWKPDTKGNVPMSASPIAKDIYAVKGVNAGSASGNATYPGVVIDGTHSATIFGQIQLHQVEAYKVFIPKAKWCKGSQGNVPPGAVQFGGDGGPLYFIRVKKGSKVCYGVLPNNMGGTPYVYCGFGSGAMPEEPGGSYEALCQ